MSKIILCCCLNISAVALAQIPNANFENWTSTGFPSYLSPDGWGNLNGPTWLVGVLTCERASGTDAYSGNYAIKLTSKTVLGLGDAPGIAVTGSINTSSQELNGGFPYTMRPDYLAGYYKYAPVAGDNAEISITLWRWNNGVREDVGEGSLFPATPQSSFMQFMVPISYTSTANPDSARILLVSTNTSNIQVGSELIVDDLEFIECLGLSVALDASGVSAPGASDGSVTASVSGGTPPIVLIWSNGDTSSMLTSLPEGTYCLTITDAAGCIDSACATVSVPTGFGFTPAQEKSVLFVASSRNSTLVHIEAQSAGLLMLTDVRGRRVMQRAFGAGTQRVDVSYLQPGCYIYMIRFFSAPEISYGKVIIAR